VNGAPSNDGGRSHRAAELVRRIVLWIVAFAVLAYVSLKGYELSSGYTAPALSLASCMIAALGRRPARTGAAAY
jgi:hypothetical protein